MVVTNSFSKRAFSPNLSPEEVAVEHVKVVLDALELVGVRLVEGQRHGVSEALLPGRVVLAAEDLGQIGPVANGDELALVTRIWPPYEL